MERGQMSWFYRLRIFPGYHLALFDRRASVRQQVAMRCILFMSQDITFGDLAGWYRRKTRKTLAL